MAQKEGDMAYRSVMREHCTLICTDRILSILVRSSGGML